MKTQKKALIAGATGLVGTELVRLIAESGYYQKIYLLVRRSSGFESDFIEEIQADFDDLESYLGKVTVNDVYCCLGTTIKAAGSREVFYKVDHDYPLEIARILKNNGADTFLNVSSLGAGSNSMIFYNRVKGELEEALKELGYRSLVILRPSLLLGERKEKRVGEDIAKKTYKVLDKIFVGPFRRYAGIQAEVVARAMFEMARKGPAEGVTILESEKIREV